GEAGDPRFLPLLAMEELSSPAAVAQDPVGRLPGRFLVPRIAQQARRQGERRDGQGGPVRQELLVAARPDPARAGLVHLPARGLQDRRDLSLALAEAPGQFREAGDDGEDRLTVLEVAGLRDAEAGGHDRERFLSNRGLERL